MRRREWTAGEAAERFVTSGLDAALSGMRQDAGRIRDAATAATQAGRNERIADCRSTSRRATGVNPASTLRGD